MAFEVIQGQFQLLEGRYYEDSAAALVAAEEKKNGNDNNTSVSESLLAAEATYYMGFFSSKGNLCVAPQRAEYTAAQLNSEAAVAKARHNVREKRAARA